MRLFSLVAALSCVAIPAVAEINFSAGGTLELYHDPAGAGTADEIDVSVYGEAEVNGVHLGAAALKSNDDTLDELSLAFGYRGDIAGIGYDATFTRYIYPNDGASNYGEMTVGLSKEFDDRFSGTLDLGYDVTNRAANAYIGAAYAATDVLEASVNFGIYEVPGLSNESEWDLGLTFALSEEVAADLRWYDGSDYVDGYIGLVLSWDTPLTR